MGFPAGWPDFSVDDRRRLVELGVSPEQVRKLRIALGTVRAVVSKRATHNGTRERLIEVEAHAKQLRDKLEALGFTQPSPEHGMAFVHLEQRYWKDPESREKTGPTVPHRLIPELNNLIDAARAAHSDVPLGAARSNTNSPAGVRAINEALRNGWYAEHRGAMCGTYPEKFAPSYSANAAFREIVEICYRAAGKKADPKNAIDAYLKIYRDSSKELLAEVKLGMTGPFRGRVQQVMSTGTEKERKAMLAAAKQGAAERAKKRSPGVQIVARATAKRPPLTGTETILSRITHPDNVPKKGGRKR